MGTRKFKVTFCIDYEIDVEIDPVIHNEEWVKGFESYMYNLDEQDEPIKDIAMMLARYHAEYGEDGRMIEGFGHITRKGELSLAERYGGAEAAPGLNIIPIHNDFDPWNIEVEEVTEKEEQP